MVSCLVEDAVELKNSCGLLKKRHFLSYSINNGKKSECSSATLILLTYNFNYCRNKSLVVFYLPAKSLLDFGLKWHKVGPELSQLCESAVKCF